jgi:hypothetical protein
MGRYELFPSRIAFLTTREDGLNEGSTDGEVGVQWNLASPEFRIPTFSLTPDGAFSNEPALSVR